jgi:hypothetical protein
MRERSNTIAANQKLLIGKENGLIDNTHDPLNQSV